ncbi:MAG: SxtJ family membrane protein [Vicinamibacterales bacterium]
MKPHKPNFKERSFGLSVGGVLIGIAAFLLWRGRIDRAMWLAGIGGVLVVLGLIAPKLLKYPSMVWWKFALALGYVNARVILTVAFLIVLTPMGLLWRIIGKDPLARQRKNWNGWSPTPARFRDAEHFKRMY